MKLVSYNLIKLIFKDSINLNSYNRVHYYARNNKLIIEYMKENENDAILLINSLEYVYDQEIIVFKINNKNPEKIDFYRELLSKDEIDLIYLQKNRNINIIKYIKNNKINDNSSNFLNINEKVINNYEQNNKNNNNYNKFINKTENNKKNQNNFNKKKKKRSESSLHIKDTSKYLELIKEKNNKNNSSYDKNYSYKYNIQNKNSININSFNNSIICCVRENEKSNKIKFQSQTPDNIKRINNITNSQNEEIKKEEDENIKKLKKEKKELIEIIERKDFELKSLKNEKEDLEKNIIKKKKI